MYKEVTEKEKSQKCTCEKPFHVVCKNRNVEAQYAVKPLLQVDLMAFVNYK